MQNLELILASGSPRRREFFTRMGWPFTVIRPGTEEKAHQGEAPAEYARRNAVEKAADALTLSGLGSRALVVAADTIVVLGPRVLEKPRSEAEARRMLQDLSGRTHQVMTGLCVRTDRKIHAETVITDVEFKRLTDAEIEAYIRSGEPMDKAGAYAIQGLAAYMIRSIRGSYTNVVGLPLTETLEALASFDFPTDPAPASAS